MTRFGLFEWDEDKSSSNMEKHGISFLVATQMWGDPSLAQIESRRDEFDEPRFLCIAKIDNVCWSAIVTFRDQRIRIISVRRARSTEVKIYEKK